MLIDFGDPLEKIDSTRIPLNNMNSRRNSLSKVSSMNSFFYELKRFSIQRRYINQAFTNFLVHLISSDQTIRYFTEFIT